MPTSATGAQLAWVLDALVNRGGKVTRAEVEAHFHPTFLAQVPADQTVEIFGQLATQLGGLVLKDVKESELRLAARIEVKDQKLQILLELDPATKQMAGLLVRPDAEAGPKPTSFEEAVKLTEALAPKAQLLIASLDKGTCKPIVATRSKDTLAIGSTFKLYVLLGLVDRILAGKARWEDELAVLEEPAVGDHAERPAAYRRQVVCRRDHREHAGWHGRRCEGPRDRDRRDRAAR